MSPAPPPHRERRGRSKSYTLTRSPAERLLRETGKGFRSGCKIRRQVSMVRSPARLALQTRAFFRSKRRVVVPILPDFPSVPKPPESRLAPQRFPPRDARRPCRACAPSTRLRGSVARTTPETLRGKIRGPPDRHLQ